MRLVHRPARAWCGLCLTQLAHRAFAICRIAATSIVAAPLRAPTCAVRPSRGTILRLSGDSFDGSRRSQVESSRVARSQLITAVIPI